jgi:hypothetical protein
MVSPEVAQASEIASLGLELDFFVIFSRSCPPPKLPSDLIFWLASFLVVEKKFCCTCRYHIKPQHPEKKRISLLHPSLLLDQ